MAMSAANQVNGGGGSSSRTLSRSPTKTETDSWAEITKSGRTTSPARASKLIEEADAEMIEPLATDVGDRKRTRCSYLLRRRTPIPERRRDSPLRQSGPQRRSLLHAESPSVWRHQESDLARQSLGLKQRSKSDARMSSEDHVSAAHVPLASRFTSTPSLDLFGNSLNNQPQAALDIKGKARHLRRRPVLESQRSRPVCAQPPRGRYQTLRPATLLLPLASFRTLTKATTRPRRQRQRLLRNPVPLGRSQPSQTPSTSTTARMRPRRLVTMASRTTSRHDPIRANSQPSTPETG